MRLRQLYLRSRRISLFAAQVFEKGFAIDELLPTALDVLIAAVKRATQVGNIAQTACYGVFHKLIRGPAALRRQFV